MAVFIDTGIFVAARNKRDVNHKRAINPLRAALKGDYGAVYTSDYVFDEAHYENVCYRLYRELWQTL